jgi:hypothetical protein
MKSSKYLLMAVAAASAFATNTTRATIFQYQAFLSGAAESPANASPATGFAEVDFDDSLNTLHVQVVFSGLLGTTTASHIHGPTASPGVGTAGVATTTPSFAGFPLSVTSGSYDHILDLSLASSYNPAFVTAHGGTTAGAAAALLQGLAAGEDYLNIHTTVAPGGEIRGFLTAVPESYSTFGLMGMGCSALLIASRKIKLA